MDKVKTSARLRTTLKIAEQCGFKYNSKRFKFGGFFNTLELEKISEKIGTLQDQLKEATIKV